MTLVAPDSTLSAQQLRSMYAEHRDGLIEVLGRLEDPEAPISVETRLLLAKDLANSYLAIGPKDGSGVPEAELVLWVNLSYEVLMAALDLFKCSVQVPFVPAPRR